MTEIDADLCQSLRGIERCRNQRADKYAETAGRNAVVGYQPATAGKGLRRGRQECGQEKEYGKKYFHGRYINDDVKVTLKSVRILLMAGMCYVNVNPRLDPMNISR